MKWLLAVVVTAVSLGCSAESPAADPASSAVDTLGTSAGQSTAPTEATSQAQPSGAGERWYSRTRTLDLTGDRAPDTVRLEASGARADSLQISLTIVVSGEEEHREEWGSSYELALADSATRTPPRADAFVRAQLDTVLASVEVERLDSPSVQLMAEDSAIIAGLEPRPEYRTSFAYGYETTVRLVWDGPRNRFVRLFSCC